MNHILNKDNTQNLSYLISLTKTLEGFNSTNQKFAVFDLDNTLIDGDIADATVAHLLANEVEIDLDWDLYLKQINDGNIFDAFVSTSTILYGMEPKCVENLAKAILEIEEPFITFFIGNRVIKVKVPKPKPLMQEYIEFLKINNFSIYIISASNYWLVKTVAKLFFNIEDEFIFGVKNKIIKIEDLDILSNEIGTICPIGKNKAEIYSEFISNFPPLITAGDSLNDKELLILTSKDGIVLWFNELDLLNQFKENLKTENLVIIN